MKPIDRSELLPLEAYESIRERFRARVIAEKRARRVRLGEELSLVFENRDTVLLQIQEMLRAERIVAEAAIRHELETYNQLVPGSGELSATLFIEIPEPLRREELLARLCAIEEHVSLEIRGARGEELARARATFEEGRRDRGRAAAVQYLKLPLGERGGSALRSAGGTAEADVAIAIDHPHLTARHPLGRATIAALIADLG